MAVIIARDVFHELVNRRVAHVREAALTAPPPPFEVQPLGSFLQRDGPFLDVELDFGGWSKSEPVSNLFRDRHLAALAYFHTF